MVKKISILLFFWLLSLQVYSQNLISYITVNTNEAYIGQPVQLKVSVFTTTWFTKGVDIGNIQVDGALTVYFRSLSNSRMINGKKYAGVDFYYNLFPAEEGTLQIPVLEIQIESPKVGDYKGIKRTIKTKPKSISVKGVPLGYDPNNWLVAYSLNITEKWSSDLTSVKVGDVIQRSIRRSAGGTLSEFIPETKLDSANGISIYPKRPQVKTNKSKTGVSASRMEMVNYLFEKEGTIIIPAIEYVYWNAGNKKFYKKQIEERTIEVKPNADLAMLASIKKSLQKEKIDDIEKEDKAFLILGLTPFDFFKYLLAALIVIFILLKIFKRLYSILKEKHTEYLLSESYAFKKVKKALSKNNFNLFIQRSNIWLSKLEFSKSFQNFVKQYGSETMKNELNQMNESYFKFNKTVDRSSFSVLSGELTKLRKNYLAHRKSDKKGKQTNKKWLNPTSVD